MLRPDAAHKALDKFRVKKWAEDRVAAVRRLAGPLVPAGLALLDRDGNGKGFKDWEKRQPAQQAAAELLDRSKPADRLVLFAALFPRLADHLDGAWQLLKKGPYGQEYDSKAFRAPNNPEITRPRRLEWLLALVNDLGGFRPDAVDVAWVAAWAPYLDYGGCSEAGFLFAAALDRGGQEADTVFNILTASAKGEHDTGGMGLHVTRAFLASSSLRAWEFIEKLLLAAQRQEGLRQSILESIDEAQPEAFWRMLRLIRDHNLTRFSATVRAVDVWLGLRWDAVSTGIVNQTIDQLLAFLESAPARRQTFRDESGETLYLALWAAAFDDAVAAIEPATQLLKDAKAHRRFAAATLLAQIHLPQARAALLAALQDEDLRIALHAWEGLTTEEEDEDEPEKDNSLFEELERLIARVPEKEKTFEPLIWPWSTVTATRRDLADQLPEYLGDRPATRLIPHLSSMSGNGRSETVQQLAQSKTKDAQTRTTLFALVGDSSSSVREEALKALKGCKATADETLVLERALTRKSGDLRRGVLSLLVPLKATALESADRLLSSTNANQRLAGLELLRLLTEYQRLKEACQQRARDFQEGRKKLTEEEREQVELVLDPEKVSGGLDDALGLLDPSRLTPVVPPQKRPIAFVTSAAIACLKSLDALIHKHRAEPFIRSEEDEDENEDEEQLLGNAGYDFPSAFGSTVPLEEDVKRLPLREVWEQWWQDRPQKLRDDDGMELLRAAVWSEMSDYEWDSWQEQAKRSAAVKALLKALSGGHKPLELQYADVVDEVLGWLLRLHPPQGAVDWLLDVLEAAYALVPAETLMHAPKTWDDAEPWHELQPFTTWQSLLQMDCGPQTAAQKTRFWQLLHWRDRPAPGAPHERPRLHILLDAYEAGDANESDILDELLGPREEGYFSSREFGSLGELTARPPHAILERRPELKLLVDCCRARILEMELARGETPTAASEPAREIRSLTGAETLFRLLAALRKRRFRKSDRQSKQEVHTHLISVTYPADGDTPEDFATRVKAALKAGLFPPERIIELAFLAPQWLRSVEHFLGWTGFSEGVWWFLAHMPNANEGVEDERGPEEHRVDDDRPSAWEQHIRARTPLTEEERNDGAVDVDWFRRAFDPLGLKRWRTLAESARYGASVHAAKKAQVLSDVLLGKAKKGDLIAGVRDRKLRESVRLLGLLPLAGGAKREADLMSRYRALLEYRRHARSLSPMSKEGALRSMAIGMENLARTAGYADPMRLEWTLEAKAIADLAAGPVARTVDGVTVTLRLDDQAQPELTVQRGNRVLKAVPAKLRKHPLITEITERKTELKRQASRMRASLETAMVRGDVFSGKELRQLFEHPMLVPMLSRLVLLGEGIAGYPEANGRFLRDHSGKVEIVCDDDRVRIAHPHDLLTGGEWHLWQRECFHAERMQPFKQVFRELYVVTEQEKAGGGTVSRRYAGQQIQESQGMALFGSRNWSTRSGVSKTFFDAGLTVSVSFRHHGWTPAQVEGPVVDEITFTRRGAWTPVPLAEVPPRLFSEVMRDLDLVVSVAHAGGVDPEATASTVEMRAALLRETCTLLKLDNVRIQGNHVLIDGQLGNYSVHLGSAVVHRQPGGSLCIVPVHAQHRGRLFLPFADDDPRTAEVISKVLLLARDGAIQDPTILAQIRAKP